MSHLQSWRWNSKAHAHWASALRLSHIPAHLPGPSLTPLSELRISLDPHYPLSCLLSCLHRFQWVGTSVLLIAGLKGEWRRGLRCKAEARQMQWCWVAGSRHQAEAKVYLSWKSGSGPRLTTCIPGNLILSFPLVLSRQPWYAKWPLPMTSPPPTWCDCPKHKMVIEPRLYTCCPLMASLLTY